MTVGERVRASQTLYARIVGDIERLIEARQLKPGDRLPPERELARLLGVSRSSVREAVKTLEATGRVRIRHGTGCWIDQPDPLRQLAGSRHVTLRELFAMRQVLEVPAAGWAAQAAPAEGVTELHELLAAMRKSKDFAELRRLDTALHIRIAELAGNRFLLQTLGVLHGLISQSMETTLTIPGRLEASRTEHRRIVDAIACADAAGARHAMLKHIRSAQAAGLLRLATEGGGLQADRARTSV